MKKFRIILLVCVAGLTTQMLMAQAVPMSTMIENENRNAVMIKINLPANIVTDALQQKLQRAGLNEKIRKGSGIYMDVVLFEISKEHIDLYTQVEEGPNNTSVLYMTVSKVHDNFINKNKNSVITQNIVTFLNCFVQDANNHFADVDITKQINNQNKSQNDYQKLLDEQADLQEKKLKIDNRLVAIQNQLDVQKIELDKKKTGIKDFKTWRSNDNNQRIVNLIKLLEM